MEPAITSNDPYYLYVTRTALGEACGLDLEMLAVDQFLDELEIEHEEGNAFVHAACHRVGRDPYALMANMPTYGSSGTELEMKSLQYLAPFSADAEKLLRLLDVFVFRDTVGSFAATLERGSFVASGIRGEGYFPPLSKTSVYKRLALALVIALVIIPGALSTYILNPLAGNVFALLLVQMGDTIRYTGPAVLALIATYVLPGLLRLKSERKRRSTRH